MGFRGGEAGTGKGWASVGTPASIIDFKQRSTLLGSSLSSALMEAVESSPRDLDMLRVDIDAQCFSLTIEIVKVRARAHLEKAWLSDEAASWALVAPLASG